MNYKKITNTLCAIIAVIASTLSAQQKPSEMLKLYSTEYAVDLKDYCHTTIDIKKGELEINRRFQRERLFLENTASEATTVSLEYNPPFTSLDDIKAYCMVPKTDKDEYEIRKVKDFTDKDIMSSDVFYEGNKATIFQYPGLQKGAITYLEYTEVVHEPKLVGSEIFQGFRLIKDQQFTLSHHKDVTIDIKYFNCSEDSFNHTMMEDGKMIIHRWTPKEYKKIKDESSMPDYLSVLPHIVYRIVSYQWKDEEVAVLRNTGDLYQWYSQLTDEVKANKSSEIDNITDSLIAGETSEAAKAEKIFKWVQSNIKYVAFEDGLGGFKPRMPGDVFAKRYGDCKDMSCLLVNMLNHANISAYHTWIGTRKLPYTYTDVPSPLTDNHMIASVYIDGEYIFLDPTNSDLPFPLPSSFTQGKEALIGLSSDSFLIQQVPIIPSTANINYDSATFELNEMDITGSGTRSYTGYYADNINYNLHNKDQVQLKNLFKSHVRKGSNKCQSDGYRLNRNPNNTSIEYQFEVPGYAYKTEDKIFINMNLEKVLYSSKIEADRVHPVEYKYAYKIIRDFTFAIPEGYTLEYIPENSTSQYEYFGYSVAYEALDGKLHYHLEIELNNLRISNDDFTNWNEMIKSLNSTYNTSITLLKS